MASKTVVEWVDDIDGEPAAETVTFALDGVEYEIDLSTEHASQLRASLAEFIRKARSDNEVTDEEPSLMPAPAPVDSGRHLPSPRSAIKSRIPANQLAMEVAGLDEPVETKPARRKPAAAATKTPVKSASARTAASKRPAAKAPAQDKAPTAQPKPVAASKAAASKTKPTAATPIKPATLAPAARETTPAASAPAASAPTAKPAAEKAAVAAPAASAPAPAPKPAASAPAPAAEPKPEPQRTAMASPFSQPAQPGVTQAKKDGPNRPPMITFSSAKPS